MKQIMGNWEKHSEDEKAPKLKQLKACWEKQIFFFSPLNITIGDPLSMKHLSILEKALN